MVTEILAGTLLGALSGLGIGGGSLLILWLTLVLGMDQAVARAVNLMFFLPSAAVSCFFRWKQGSIRWTVILPAAITGCASCVLGSLLGMWMDTRLLRKLFGGLLMVTGLRELFWKQKK